MEQATLALWTANMDDLPWEFTEMRLCRDVYKCLPSQLDDESWDRIQKHLAMMVAEAKTV